ncbi:O-antigen ligase family protein [Candidatus Gottesmanbacteria bacterium]|nr:O-antigen ligase family protein [Candidatus Gottesmanbacteria bacterium]
MIYNILIALLWVSLLLGQLGVLPLAKAVHLYVQDMVLILIILYAVFRDGLIGKLSRLRLAAPIALFVGLGIMSLAANMTQYPLAVTGKGSLYLWRWAVYALFYAVVVNSPLSSRFWLRWLAGFGVALSILGLLQLSLYPDLRNLWYLGWDPHYYRVFATLLDPNYVGILLVLTIFLWGYLFVTVKRKFQLLIGIGIAVSMVTMLLTYSRGSYLAFLVGIGVAVALLGWWKRGLFIGLIFLLAIVYIPKPGGQTLTLDRYDSTVSRLQNWDQMIARIGERPVFGFGLNVVPFLSSGENRALPGRAGAGIDSSILFVGVTTGIMGLAGYLWLLLQMVKPALTRKRTPLMIMYVSSFGAIIVHSLFVNSLFYPWVMVWLWTLVGVAEREALSNKAKLSNGKA